MKTHPALTICLIFFTNMTCMLPYCASETSSPATLRIKCVENCTLHESEVKCQMKTKDGKSLTLYCPAENSQEHSQEHSQDHEWTGLYCETGDKYYLCQVDNSLQSFKDENNHHWLKSKANDEEIFLKTVKIECIQAIFEACKDLKHIADGYSLRKEIIELIAKWDNGYLQNKPKSGLIKSKNLRIDLQGVFPRENQRYYNLQIQINGPRKPGESTTVSQIIIPVDPEIPVSYVRRAFTESFHNRAKVTGEVTYIEQCKSKK